MTDTLNSPAEQSPLDAATTRAMIAEANLRVALEDNGKLSDALAKALTGDITLTGYDEQRGGMTFTAKRDVVVMMAGSLAAMLDGEDGTVNAPNFVSMKMSDGAKWYEVIVRRDERPTPADLCLQTKAAFLRYVKNEAGCKTDCGETGADCVCRTVVNDCIEATPHIHEEPEVGVTGTLEASE